jgi:hypothetical protein
MDVGGRNKPLIRNRMLHVTAYSTQRVPTAPKSLTKAASANRSRTVMPNIIGRSLNERNSNGRAGPTPSG